jgi:hypothetical protein
VGHNDLGAQLLREKNGVAKHRAGMQAQIRCVEDGLDLRGHGQLLDNNTGNIDGVGGSLSVLRRRLATDSRSENEAREATGLMRSDIPPPV